MEAKFKCNTDLYRCLESGELIKEGDYFHKVVGGFLNKINTINHAETIGKPWNYVRYVKIYRLNITPKGNQRR